MKTVNLFDCNVAALTRSETLVEIEDIIKKRITTQHVVINAGKVVLMQKTPKLKEIIQNCPLINADGQSIVWASKFLKRPVPERVTGIDLMFDLVKLAAQKGYRVFFFGAKQEVVESVMTTFCQQYPTLQIAGYRNGYFKTEQNPEIVQEIRASKADILFVAFSSPHKEYWLANHLQELNVPFCMGVGGSFDVVANVTRRAPLWMQRNGLEWFYRVIQEPGRMWKRYLYGNLKFLQYCIREKMH